jgi:aminoglycoside phosphotransferase (APT) family kinase protein
LSQWLHSQQQIAFADTRVGRELAATCADHPIFKSNSSILQARNFRATIYHGDFTPWNIRVATDGAWTVLDWERGEVNGLPAWDWFHYLVQKSILVQHRTAESVADRLDALLALSDFKTYAATSGVMGYERALCLLYLLHHLEVVRPSEGLPVTHELIKLLATRWR